MRNDLLKAAIWYCRNGYSVIPVKRNKRPHIKWEEWQTKRADEDQVISWWNKWPDAQVALVCGEISNITVIDADSEDSYINLNENFIPDSLSVPTSKTSKGYHFYFRYLPGISNSVRFMDECDLRNDGGYILAPPSLNENGSYAWLKGLKINEVHPPEMPSFLVDVIKQSVGTVNANKIGSNHYTSTGETTDASFTKNLSTSSTLSTEVHRLDFNKGKRDDSLFHVANCCIKGGMSETDTFNLLKLLADNCSPPFNKTEAEIKVRSAIQRSMSREGSLSSEIRDWVMSTSGHFLSTEIHKDLSLSTRVHKKNCSEVLRRMVEEGTIERIGNKNGQFRRVEIDCKPQNLCGLNTNPINIIIPFELTDKVLIYPGDIILVSGSQNAGKSAFMLNMAKENYRYFDTHFFSSEMRAESFVRRVNRFVDLDKEHFIKNIKFYDTITNIQDKVKSGKGVLNIIDYLEMHDQFWLVAQSLAKIYERLKGAIAVVAIQKDPGREYGRGGSFTQEKPVLAISLDKGKAKITKCKDFPEDKENIEGKQYEFKLVQGCRFMRRHMELGWHKE